MPHYIGIDLHKKTSQIAVLDGDSGVFILQKSIRSLPHRFSDELKDHRGAKVLVEASTVSRWVVPLLRRLGFEVILGDPNFALMYASRSTICKNDKHDARALAFACKEGHYRVVHEPNAEQAPIAALLGTRSSQVQRRTAAINRTRALYLATGVELLPGAGENFWARTKSQDGFVLLPAAAPLLDELAMLEDLIAATNKRLDEIATNHPVVQRLMTVPGVGTITALSFFVKIGDCARFPTARQVESYLGLVPTLSTTGGPGAPFRLSKRGSTMVRALLVQAAWSLAGSNDPKAALLKEWFLKLEQRSNSQKAIVALARRLAGLLFAIMRDGTAFELREPKPVVPKTEAPKRPRRYQLKPSVGQPAV
jgi:transposase